MLRPTARSWSDAALAATGAAWLALGLAACGRDGAPATAQRAEDADAARIYADLVAPLSAGQEALVRALAVSDAKPIAFRLAHGGAVPLPSASGADLIDPLVAVFYRAPAAGDRPARCLYLDPSALELASADASEAAQALDAGLVVADHRLSLVRAVPLKTAARDDQLEIERFDFVLSADGEPTAAGGQRLTDDPADDSQAVALPDRTVAFLRQNADGRRRLMRVPLTGGTAEPLLAEQPFDVRLPRLVAGALLIAADAGGEWKLRAIDPAKRSWSDFTGPAPVQRGPRDVLLASRLVDGHAVPQLVALPATYDLDALLALVSARNPAVNKRRALLAAALVEARQLHLARLPTLTWDLSYTAAEGLLGPVNGAPGDVLAANLGRGLFGLVQPLLELPRTNALAEAGRIRAEIARDVLADELNSRLADAAEWWFRAAGARAAAAIHGDELANADERGRYVAALSGEKEVARAGVLDAQRDLASARAAAQLAQKQLDYALSRLRELADLPPDCPLALSDDPFRFDLAPEDSFAALRRTALLNHPRLRAARRALVEAFFERKADARFAPSASLGAEYGDVRRRFSDPVDDYIALSLSGTLPLAALSDAGLKVERWKHLADAIDLDTQEQAQVVAGALDDALIAQERARSDLTVRRAELAARLEAVRVARLHLAVGAPEGAGDPSRGDLLAAHAGWYRALGELADARVELAVRRCRLYREMGLADHLRADSEPLRATRVAQAATARWLWHARALVDDDAAVSAFLAEASAGNVHRVYAYLESDARLLADAQASERLALFIDRCAAADIAVWGLMGEPEWLADGGEDALAAGARRMADFNRRFPAAAPCLAGLKLDIEPHALPGWSSDAAARDELAARWLALIGRARRELPALPLWCDCPVQFFRPETGDLLARLGPLVDGVTLMAYGDREAWIGERTAEALACWPKALELGLETGPGAPAGETLASWRADEIDALRGRLVARFQGEPRFAGLAIHHTPRADATAAP